MADRRRSEGNTAEDLEIFHLLAFDRPIRCLYYHGGAIIQEILGHYRPWNGKPQLNSDPSDTPRPASRTHSILQAFTAFDREVARCHRF